MTLSKIQNLVRLAKVDVSGPTPQVRYFSGRAMSDVPHMEPQGVHFRPAAEASGVMLAPAAEVSSAVLIDAQGAVPSDDLGDGEGGLHYLGTFKVFVAADGTLHLGEKDPEDWVALASKVDDIVSKLDNMFRTWVVAPNDGGAALKAKFTAAFPSAPASVASAKVRCG